jgi:branched-chain amino acid transport system substrate-binding protein
MGESDSTALTKTRRAAFAGTAALLLFASAACSSSTKSSAAPQSATSTTAATTAASLGTLHRATGTPVKVGLLTTGGNCSGCTSNYEAPAARAAVAWLNDYNNGLAGHPITLDVCVDNNDPGKGSDCANQMLRDNVGAVVLGSSGISVTEWKILHDAGVLVQDAKSTFLLGDPQAQTVTLPIAVAKSVGAKDVSFLVVDYPDATDIYKADSTKKAFEKAGIKFDVTAVPLGQADMTPQAQHIVATNPGGVVAIIGSDVTCIPALNALHELGYHGTITTISYCITDAMRKAVPGGVLKGVRFSAEAPFGDTSDPSMRQYAAVLAKYAKGKVPPADQPALTVFESVAAISVGTQDLKGAVTPASVIAAMKAMKTSVLPASGGRVFRCSGKASTAGPAVCSVSTITGSLDANGIPTDYAVANNGPVPG